MPETSRYLSQYVIDQLAREIADHGGAELFAVLTKSPGDDYYSDLKVVTRGAQTEVPVLVSRANHGDMTVHNHPSGVLTPSQADFQVATLFGEEGVGSMIVNNDVSQCTIIAEPATDEKIVDVDATEVERLFANDGPLAKILSPYEARSAQVELSKEIARSFNQQRILAAEAGTGTGKSLAYLIPALLWTKHNKGRVVIATKTIALQEQLVHKDIPIARSAVPDAPQASLVKGRGNYICLRKLRDVTDNQLTLFESEEDADELKKQVRDIADWVEQGNGGDRADLPFQPHREAWDLVRSDADMCLGAKCPHFNKSPFYESRRAAAKAKVLVLNQALLFADLAVRAESGDYKSAAVIPPYDRIVLDEAHSIEDIATDHFGQKISSFGLRLTLGKFYSGGRKGNRGVLHRLFQVALEKQRLDLVRELEETHFPAFNDLQLEVNEQVLTMAASLHQVLNPENRRQEVIWLKDDLLESGRLEQAREDAKILLERLHLLLLRVRKIRARLETEPEQFQEKINGMKIEIDARMSRLENTAGALKQFAVKPDDNQVPWLELKKTRTHNEFDYRVSPLNVAPLLREALFKPFKSVILTSATLDLDDRFDFLSKRNGLAEMDEKEWGFNTYPTPFDYGAQAKLMLADMRNTPQQQGYLDELCEIILRAAFSSYIGGTLVLFTSYQALNEVARRVDHPLADGGIPLHVQGKAPRRLLLERMRQAGGVLLGTDSFWEGVDLPGNALTKVIIAKLPFHQIGDPIFEARCNAIERNGKSSFRELSLPVALLKFKQGAGRLIRTKLDQGVLIVADNRIQSKSYGRRFLKLVSSYPQQNVPPQHVTDWLRSLTEVVYEGR